MMRERMTRILCVAIAMALFVSLCPVVGAAKDATLNVSATIYEFEEKSHYEISSGTRSSENSFGSLSLSGNLRESGTTDGFAKYVVNTGRFSISYALDQNKLTVPSTTWHIVEDKSKEVDSYSLDKNILSGAIIVQSSRDNKLWQTDVAFTNIFTDVSVLDNPIFEATEIQLDNGCYYRIIVAYKLEKQVESSSILGIEKENFEHKKVAEVYKFYAVTGDTSKTSSPDDKPRKELGATTKTELDNGYTGTLAIDKKDPHDGWGLGTFVVNGYTRETEEDGTPVFLKNTGDNVTLWFVLDQDINCLNGNSSLTISEDTNGSETHTDPKLSIKQTNMKHGALIVRHTNSEGHTTVTPYFDFLAANARTTANTKILLREEGDYEISLLYEIEKCDVQVGSLKVIPSYTNYKINFSFKIRNSNAMVFPFDCKTGKELSDKEHTPNGFTLNLANSQYLTIDVIEHVINVRKDGTLVLDLRQNKAAKEDVAYSEDGIYTITAKNLYSDGDPTTKTIFVGSNKYIIAMSKGYSIDSLNSLIRDGATIEEDGTITMPPPPTEATEPRAEESQSAETTVPSKPMTTEATAAAIATEPIWEQTEPANTETVDTPMLTSISPIACGALAVAVVVISFVIKKRKKHHRSDES